MAHQILIVDDDPHICDVIAFALRQAGMKTRVANDGAEGLKEFNAARPDLIVLDVGMPEMDGLELCRQIRKSADTPILFLSARDDEVDRIIGLEIGGDDYVTKPFSPRELVARVSVILKRAGRAAPENEADGAVLEQGQLRLDRDHRAVALNGAPLSMTALEFEILATLMTRPGVVFSRDQLMETAYPGNIHVAERTIDSHVRNIRAKFAKAGCEGIIETVHGVGFRLGNCEAG